MNEFPYNDDGDDQGFLVDLADELRTQDNCATARPIWTIQVKRRRYGINEESNGADGWTLCDDSGEAVTTVEDRRPKDVKASLAAQGWEWRPFLWEWIPEPGRVALTRKGIDAHLAVNRHNYPRGEGRVLVYVESLFRCPDLERLIELAKSGRLKADTP